MAVSNITEAKNTKNIREHQNREHQNREHQNREHQSEQRTTEQRTPEQILKFFNRSGVETI